MANFIKLQTSQGDVLVNTDKISALGLSGGSTTVYIEGGNVFYAQDSPEVILANAKHLLVKPKPSKSK